MTSRGRVAYLCLAMVVGACTAPAASQVHRPPNLAGVIAFSDRGDIFVIRADGTGRRPLTDTVGTKEGQPAWSPDGSQIIFARGSLTGSGLYVMTVGDRQGSRVPTNLAGVGPAWSPDGTMIALGDAAPRRFGSSNAHGFGDLYVMTLDAARPTRLTRTEGKVTMTGAPSWSPDGSRIVYRTLDYRTVESTGFIMAADGSPTRKLAKNMDEPDWSPDGTAIAFSRKFRGGFDLCVMDLEGGQVTRLTERLFPHPVSPTWSPNGRRIAFAGTADFPGDLYVIDANGSNLLSLATDGLVSDPDWKPAG